MAYAQDLGAVAVSYTHLARCGVQFRTHAMDPAHGGFSGSSSPACLATLQIYRRSLVAPLAIAKKVARLIWNVQREKCQAARFQFDPFESGFADDHPAADSAVGMSSQRAVLHFLRAMRKPL